MSRRVVAKWDRKGGMVFVLWKERDQRKQRQRRTGGYGSLLATQGHGDIGPGLLPRAMSGSVILLQLPTVLMSVTRVTTGSLQLKYEDHAEPALPFTGPGESWPHSLLDTVVRTHPNTLAWESCSPAHHGCARADPVAVGIGELAMHLA